MPVFSKCRRSSAFFSCDDPLESYKCSDCDYTYSEKVSGVSHNDEFNFLGRPRFKRCKICRVGSFSILWRLSHRRNCNFGEDRSVEAPPNDASDGNCSITRYNKAHNLNNF